LFSAGIYSDEQVAGWKKVVDSVHAHKSLIFLQLWHIGRVAHPLLQNGRPNVGPSALAAKGGKFRQLEGAPGYVVPEAIADPEQYIALYKRAAERAKEAGFDGVELHKYDNLFIYTFQKFSFFLISAGGYLAHQFLDNTSNHRTDKWGGSAENRCRFSLRVIDEICGVYGNDRVGIKLSPGGGYNDMGMNQKDTSETYGYLIKELNARHIAYIQVTRYWALGDPVKRGMDVDIFQWKDLINRNQTKFFVNTDYDAKQGAEVLKAGLADAVVFGRLYIGNPDLAERLINNQEVNTNLNMKGLYNGQEEGYTDYPTYEQQHKVK
jgi:2,4-dienoyl-CoA reductase-like NADH-dependent reductase (Old Yellow Enzyme family)